MKAGGGQLDEGSLDDADGGYAGKLVLLAKHHLRMAVQIAMKPEANALSRSKPRGWVVERTLSWINDRIFFNAF